MKRSSVCLEGQENLLAGAAPAAGPTQPAAKKPMTTAQIGKEAEQVLGKMVRQVKAEMRAKPCRKNCAGSWCHKGTVSTPAVFSAMLGARSPDFRHTSMSVDEFCSLARVSSGEFFVKCKYNHMSMGGDVHLAWWPDACEFAFFGSYTQA